MNANELEKSILLNMKHLDKQTFARALNGASPEEIDTITKHIVSFANDIRCMYQLIKGNICCTITTEKDFEKAVWKTFKHASFPIKLYENWPPKGVGGEIVLDSETEEDAIQDALQELEKLAGMYSILDEYTQFVMEHCRIYKKVLFEHDTEAIDKWGFLCGQQNEDGSWDIEACRRSFQGLMLFLMDQFDTKSTPYRITGSKESE